MEIVIKLIIYSFIFIYAFILYRKYGKKLGEYFAEMFNPLLAIPIWLFWTFTILLFFLCVIIQASVLFESLIIWLVLSIIIPFFYSPIRNNRIFNFLSISTFFLTTIFSVTLFFKCR